MFKLFLCWRIVCMGGDRFVCAPRRSTAPHLGIGLATVSLLRQLRIAQLTSGLDGALYSNGPHWHCKGHLDKPLNDQRTSPLSGHAIQNSWDKLLPWRTPRFGDSPRDADASLAILAMIIRQFKSSTRGLETNLWAVEVCFWKISATHVGVMYDC